MIEFLSSWAKSLGLAIVIVSILEMLLPNNKNKKYIRMVMGIYIIFNIVSPFIKNQDKFNIENIDIKKYLSSNGESVEVISEQVNQTSMNERIKDLYIEELEKDISKKIEEQGYKVNSCKVKATISSEENKTEIKEIKLKVEKNNNSQENKQNEKNVEDKIVTEIQKIKKVDTTINTQKEKEQETKDESTISKSDIQNIKKFLIEEYEVNEKCLKIN